MEAVCRYVRKLVTSVPFFLSPLEALPLFFIFHLYLPPLSLTLSFHPFLSQLPPAFVLSMAAPLNTSVGVEAVVAWQVCVCVCLCVYACMKYELFQLNAGSCCDAVLGAVGGHMCACRRRLQVQRVWQAGADFLCNYSGSHLFWNFCHTQSVFRAHGPSLQASLALNPAHADSNFCPQITFQRLHKSAASSHSASVFPLLLLCHPFSRLWTPPPSINNDPPPTLSTFNSPYLSPRRSFPPSTIACFLVPQRSHSLALAP